MEKLRESGARIVLRSACSHSPVDIVAIYPDGVIKLVQCKPDSMSENEKLKLSMKENWLNERYFKVLFEVW